MLACVHDEPFQWMTCKPLSTLLTAAAAPTAHRLSGDVPAFEIADRPGVSR
jgi:hypothetical protein